MKSIADLNLKDKIVLVRADFNVPLDADLHVTNNKRIREFIPTLKFIQEKGGKPVLMSHLGRPDGKPSAKYSLKSIISELEKLSGAKVIFTEDCIAESNRELANNLKSGELLLLENLRFHAAEQEGCESFAKKIAQIGDVYINDAFGTAHRADASMFAVAKLFTDKAPGLLMQKELDYFSKALEKPERPLCVVLGGAKVSSKLPVLVNLASKADHLIIGGAMANTFLAQQGLEVGKSLHEKEMFPEIVKLQELLKKNSCQLHLPVDFRLGESFDKPGTGQVALAEELPTNLSALDIGPKSSEIFAKVLKESKTIVWNGPMGAFENPDFATGTLDLTKAIAEASGLSVVGGGDTVAAVEQMGLEASFDFLSTGGGAFLTLMEGVALPGIEALK